MLPWKFINGPLKRRYDLDTTIGSKDTVGGNDLLLLLGHHWAKDTAVSPDEEQRVQFATIFLFAAFTASRPVELVDASLSKKDRDTI